MIIYGASRFCGSRAGWCRGRYLTETPPASSQPSFSRCPAVCLSFLRVATAGTSSWWLLRKPPATGTSRLFSARLHRRFFRLSGGGAGWLVQGALPNGNAPCLQPAHSIFGAAFGGVSRSCGYRAGWCGGRYLTETPPASSQPFFFRCSAVCSSFLRWAAAGSSSWWLLRKPPATTTSRLFSSRRNRPFFGRPSSGGDARGAHIPNLAQR